MNKSDQDFEGLSRQKPFDGHETEPDMNGDKVWHSTVSKTRNNKPKPNK